MVDLALFLFVTALLALGLKRPFLWVLAYIYIDIVAPQKISWHLLASIPISLIVFVAAFGGWLVWTGLAPDRPVTADFEPFFPWFAPFLAGLATGRILSHLGLWARLSLPETPLLRRLAWPGRHSLAIYLIHQPVLIGLVAGATWAAAALR